MTKCFGGFSHLYLGLAFFVAVVVIVAFAFVDGFVDGLADASAA